MPIDGPDAGSAGLPRADDGLSDPSLLREAFHRALLTYWAFHVDEIEPQLARLGPGLGIRQAACIDIHYALCGLLRCLIELRDPPHIQGVASCVRSIFEIATDQLLLVREGISSHRFRNFPDIERMRVLRLQLEHETTIGKTSDPEIVRFVQRHGPLADATLLDLWQTKNSPSHWSGIRSFEKRAARVGYLGLYVQYYPALSWFVHTATVGTAGATPNAIAGLVTPFLDLVRQLIPTAFETLVKEIGIPIEGLGEKVEGLRNAPLLHLLELKQG